MSDKLFLPKHLQQMRGQTTELERSAAMIHERVIQNREAILKKFGEAYMAETGLHPSQVCLVQRTVGTEIQFQFDRRPLAYPNESKLMVALKQFMTARTHAMRVDEKDAIAVSHTSNAYKEALDHLTKTMILVELEHEAERKKIQEDKK